MHLWILWEWTDLVAAPRQSGRVPACVQNGQGPCGNKPGCGRRNRVEHEYLFNPNWCNKSYFSSRMLVYLYTEAFVKCNFIVLIYSGRGKPHGHIKKHVRWWWAGIPELLWTLEIQLVRTPARYSFRFHIQVIVQDRRFFFVCLSRINMLYCNILWSIYGTSLVTGMQI